MCPMLVLSRRVRDELVESSARPAEVVGSLRD
jgi:hypothetical protein